MARTSTVFITAAVLVAIAAPLQAALVGFWEFDGSLADSSGMGNNGSASWSPVVYGLDRFDAAGSAIVTPGGTSLVTTATGVRPTNTFSFGGWIKTSEAHEIDPQSNGGTLGTTGQRYAFGAWNGSANAGAGLSVGINGISVYEHGSSYMPALAVYNPGDTAAIGTGWNHIMVVYQDRVPTIYLNGVLVRTGVQSARSTVYAPHQIGGGSYGGLNGSMDAVGVWDRALLPSEIGALAGLIVANGHFDANAASFTHGGGAFGDGGNPTSVPGWTGGSGIHGTATGLASSPFAPTTNTQHSLFIQGTGTLEQTITTTQASPYLFTFEAAARSGSTAGVTVHADASADPSLILGGPGEDSRSWWLSGSSFQKYAFAFTGAGSQTIRFTGSGTGEHTTSIDNVAVALIDRPIAVTNGTTFFTETAGTASYDFRLEGTTQTFFQRPGTPTYTGNITTDGSAGTLNIHSFGRQAGARNLTFSGGTIALGNKTLSLSGRVSGGNVDGLSEANAQMTTLHDVTLSTNADVHVTRGALRIAGNSVVSVGGRISPPPGDQGGFAWNSLIIQDSAQVTVTGGIDFSNIASNLAFNGGTLTTPSIWGNVYGGTQAIFNGTRIVASQDNPDFLRVSTGLDKQHHSSPARLGSAGAIFDSNGHNVGVQVALADLSGQAGTLTKLGAGTLALGGVSTYTGATKVQQGALVVNGSLTGTSAVDVGVELVYRESATIYRDGFGGSAATNLHGTMPVVGSDAWTASTLWKADGSKSVTNTSANAFLPFTPSAGHLYSLSLDVNTTAGNTDWIALGYSAGNNTSVAFHTDPNNTVGWILRTATGGFQTFLGPVTAISGSHPGSPGWVNLEVRLDTTGDDWLFEWFVDGASIRGPQALANPVISHVGFGAYRNAVGQVDNFRLAVLEPSLALLGGTGAIAGDTTIGPYGTLAPGQGIGTLTFSDGAGLTLAAGATIDWEFLNNTAEGSTYDHIIGQDLYLPDSEGAITLSIAGLDGYSVSAGDSFTLFSGNVHVGSMLAEYGQDITHLFNITHNTNWWGTWEVTAGSLILTAVPEPGAWVLLLSAMAFGLMRRRRMLDREMN